MKKSLIAFSILLLGACAHVEKPVPSQLEGGKAAIHKMTGCYLVDYNYAETEAIKPGYTRDARFYDVNKNKSVKEWVYADDISPTRVRLQHILFMTDAEGKINDQATLKHQAEDWEYQAPFIYEFAGDSKWTAVKQPADSKTWIRRITNLDDGLRYQCASHWRLNTAYPEWTCDDYAPIPGRETRDMKRKDYQALQRSTRLIVYGDSWLERQNNTKMIDRAGVKTPLAKEAGKNWYVRVPDAECSAMHDFVNQRKDFWALLRGTWDEVFTGDSDFIEQKPQGQPPRFVKMMKVEEEFANQDLSKAEIREKARDQILKVIREYRKTPETDRAASTL
jgi:hypothetical protein